MLVGFALVRVRVEQEEFNLATCSAAVGQIGWPQLVHEFPNLFPFGGVGHQPSSDWEFLPRDGENRRRLINQVQRPSGVVALPEVRAHQQEVVSSLAIEQCDGSWLPGLAAGRRQQTLR